MNISEQKSKIRNRFLAQRKSFSEEDYRDYSKIIKNRLESLSVFQKASVVHCYISLNDRREVDTHPLIKQLISDGKKIVAPVSNFQDHTLDHRCFASFDELALNKWEVLEPVNGAPTSVSKLDVVIVPMVGADELGNRIGYGKGFYDRFLKDVSVAKIGLVFERMVVKKLPVENVDVPMDIIITEKRIIHQ